MAGALSGVTVLEVADYITGPYAGMLLADLGADVIKIEKRPFGDPFRGFDRESGKEGYNTGFVALNRNKRSLTLNLGTTEGQQIFRQLASTASVVIENHRPGQMRRWGLDYETLQQANPGLVYCSISGFGQDGPYRDLPGYDTLGVAMGGLLSLLTDLSAPEPSRFTFADHLTGIFACYGVLGALYARAETGRGQKVETSLLQSIVSFVQLHAARYLSTGEPTAETGRPNLAAAFVAGDGKPFVFHLSSPPKFWEGLTEALGKSELREDARFMTRDARIRNYDALRAICQEVFATAPRQHWVDLLRAHDVPCGPLYTMPEVFEDAHVQQLGLPVEVTHPVMGKVRLSGGPVNLGETPIRYATAPPLLGEHTVEILSGLGLDEARIGELSAAGVV
ncbi:MAG TPA: CaiB/BaiF CoA-transferase family protein [Chloroflexota bacterium]|nr:CaiB/BaiF CoA-transferase family protein [Chloroflexota bacterium]